MTKYNTGGPIPRHTILFIDEGIICATDAEVRAGFERWYAQLPCSRCGAQPVETTTLGQRTPEYVAACRCHPWARQPPDRNPFPRFRRLLTVRRWRGPR